MLICINVIPQRAGTRSPKRMIQMRGELAGGHCKEVHCANASVHPLGSTRKVARRA